MVRRKVSDVWAAVNSDKPANMNCFEWKQSYIGVSAALAHVGLVITTSQDEFDKLPIPEYKGDRRFAQRKIVVSRNGVKSPKTTIRDLLNGHASLPTPEELAASHAERGVILVNTRQKGTACSHAVEVKASEDLSHMLNLGELLRKVTLFEGRLADIAYCQTEDDIASNVFVADQEKSACESEQGQLTFNANHTNITFQGMIDILQTGYSLTMIGRRRSDGLPDVVWLFFGESAITDLSSLSPTVPFAPRLHLKIKSSLPATLLCNKPEYRFDIGKSETEIKRLQDRRIQIVREGTKHTLQFLNEDISQITSPNQKIEHKSFLLTRAACIQFECLIEHFAEDSYSLTDFRMDKTCRIQDKVGDEQITIRQPGGHPLNPDKIDIFQITNLNRRTVYAIPVRKFHESNVICQFDDIALMKTHWWFSVEWKNKYADFLFDMNDGESIQHYIRNCKAAAAVPPLTNTSFYNDLLEANKDSFHVAKRYPKKKT